MPITIGHNKTLTMADATDTNIVRPSDWNSNHLVTLNISGTDIIGAFSNAGNVTFGTDIGGYVTANAPTGTGLVGTGFSGTNASGTMDSNGLQLSVAVPGGGGAALQGSGTYTQNTGTIQFANSNNMTFGLTANQMTASFSQTVDTNKAGIGYTSTTQGGSTVGVTNNTQGLSVAWPAYVTAAGAGDGNNVIGVNAVATAASTTYILSNGNNVSFGINAGTITASASYVNDLTSGRAGTGFTTTTAAGVLWSGTNDTAGLKFAMPAYITTYAAQTNQSAIKAFGVAGTVGTAGNTGLSTGIDWAIAGSNLITVSGSTAAGVATAWIQHPAWLTTAALSGDTTKYAGVSSGSQSTVGSDIVFTHNTAGLNLGVPKYLTTAALSANTSNYAGVGYTSTTQAGSTVGVTHNTSGLSIAWPPFITTGGAGGGAAISANGTAAAGSNSQNTGTVVFANANGITFGLSNNGSMTASHNGLITAAASDHSHGNPTLSLAGGLSGATASNSAGFTLSLTQAAAAPSPINFSAGTTTSAVSGLTFSNSNNVTFGLGTGVSEGVVTASFNPINIGVTNSSASGTTGTVDGAGAQYLFFGGANITLSQSLNGASGSLSIIGPAAGGGVTLQGGYTNLPYFTGTVTLGYVQSTSHVVPFIVPNDLSFDYIRMEMLGAVSAASTTAATAGGTQFSCGYTKTHNFAIYSMATGANSDSLQLYKSTQFLEYFSNNISCAANSTQFSYSNRYTYPCSSGSIGFTHDYSSSVAGSINQNSASATMFTGTKFIEFPFGTSLAAGRYWLMYGCSTTTATQVAGTTIGIRNAVTFNPVFMSQAAISVGTLGATTSNIYAPQMGCGSFTTVGGATTNSLHWSKVTISANNPMLYFHLMRSA